MHPWPLELSNHLCIIAAGGGSSQNRLLNTRCTHAQICFCALNHAKALLYGRWHFWKLWSLANFEIAENLTFHQYQLYMGMFCSLLVFYSWKYINHFEASRTLTCSCVCFMLYLQLWKWSSSLPCFVVTNSGYPWKSDRDPRSCVNFVLCKFSACDFPDWHCL